MGALGGGWRRRYLLSMDERVKRASGKTGRLHIAIECHACFDWLFPVLELFRHAWPEVDVDIRAGLAFGRSRRPRSRPRAFWLATASVNGRGMVQQPSARHGQGPCDVAGPASGLADQLDGPRKENSSY